jgi:hypothetical protein
MSVKSAESRSASSDQQSRIFDQIAEVLAHHASGLKGPRAPATGSWRNYTSKMRDESLPGNSQEPRYGARRDVPSGLESTWLDWLLDTNGLPEIRSRLTSFNRFLT